MANKVFDLFEIVKKEDEWVAVVKYDDIPFYSGEESDYKGVILKEWDSIFQKLSEEIDKVIKEIPDEQMQYLWEHSSIGQFIGLAASMLSEEQVRKILVWFTVEKDIINNDTDVWQQSESET